MLDSAKCERCAGPTEYFGRISLPPRLIYHCKPCGYQTWVADAPTARSRLPEQPQAQQQQQPQPEKMPEGQEPEYVPRVSPLLI